MVKMKSNMFLAIVISMAPVMLIVSMAPCHFLGQGNWNEVQHDVLVIHAIGTGISVT